MADQPTPAAFDIEKPACFYLGREFDLASQSILPDGYVMYDARDLTTHGVIVGMTGSGKTGLAISLLEEAAIDGISCIIIDPKGDLTNLLLQFPDLDPQSFAKWINPEDAQQKSLSVDEYAKQIAERWRAGLAQSAQTPERISRLRDAAEYRIYTPGSTAGLPVSVLSMFKAPRAESPREEVNQKSEAAASSLLALTGEAVDPIQSREHILLSNLLQSEWSQGRDVDLIGLIRLIEKPPLRNIGAYSLETFFPAKERVKFAATLNNVLAAPSFQTWTEGEPLNLAEMLSSPGKRRQLIFYTAHLDDGERMWFTTLLLYEALAWARKQGGTTNLRALLYFDEVYGYLPPTANPPSKRPLLTLLKQARAFGVGVLLATQNPIDLDYKALSNAGTWIIGKLQTARDKDRLLKGLESVAAEQGTMTDRSYLEKVIASLGNRIFLLHDIHRPRPLLFQSRWALSFLRGPMTREQVAELMKPLKEQPPPAAIPLCTSCRAELGPDVVGRCPTCGQDPYARARFRLDDQAFRAALSQAAAPMASAPEGQAPTEAGAQSQPPVLPPEVTQFYIPLRPGADAPAGAALEYQPCLLGFAEVTFLLDRRTGAEHCQPFRLLAQPTTAGHPTAWDEAESLGEALDAHPQPRAHWAGVPETLDTGRKLKALEKAFAEYLYSSQKLSLFQNKTLGLVSAPGEEEEAFVERCREAAEVQAEQALEMERIKFAPKFEALDAELPLDQPAGKSGGSLLGWLNPFGGAKKESNPRHEEKVKKLTADYIGKRAELREKWKRIGAERTAIQVKPRKADVRVTHFGLAWVPCFQRSLTGGKVERIAAHR